MRCPNCQTQNPDASAFCKECGAQLAPPTPPTDEKRARELVEEGFRLSDEGKLAQAITAAKRAVAANPDSTSAYSLLGILYERSGQRELAMQAYEAALRLSLESAADRKSLRQLITPPAPPEAAVEARPSTEIPARPTAPAPPRLRPRPGAPQPSAATWYALAFLGIALLILLAVTIRVWRGGPKQLRPVATGRPAVLAPAGVPARAPAPPQPAPAPIAAAIPLTLAAPAPLAPPAAPARQAPVSTAPIAVEPEPPEPVDTITIPAPITFISPSAAAPPESQPAPAPAEREAAPSAETARTRYFDGDLAGALRIYEGIVADQAKATPQAYQEMAWVYYQAGRRTDAAAAYRESLARYQQQLAAGIDVDAALHGIRTSEAALKVLEVE